MFNSFIDPAWGFATGWNYAITWLMVLPLELISASITLQYWHSPIPAWATITLFMIAIIAINLCGIKTYGEAEYGFSILKIVAIIGFMYVYLPPLDIIILIKIYSILGAVINCAGGPTTGYIGGKYWRDPGGFHDGFKGFCNILVTAAFAFNGTELVGLAAAEVILCLLTQRLYLRSPTYPRILRLGIFLGSSFLLTFQLRTDIQPRKISPQSRQTSLLAHPHRKSTSSS